MTVDSNSIASVTIAIVDTEAQLRMAAMFLLSQCHGVNLCSISILTAILGDDGTIRMAILLSSFAPSYY
jgi:hypothetical protein